MGTATPDQSNEDAADKPKALEKVCNAIETTGSIMETLMLIFDIFSS